MSYESSEAVRTITVEMITVTLNVSPTFGNVGDTFTFSGMVTADSVIAGWGRIDLVLEGVGVVASIGADYGAFSIPWVADRAGSLTFHAEAVILYDMPPYERAVSSPPVTITVTELIETALTIIAPDSVGIDKIFTVSGILTRTDTGAGLRGQTINISYNGVSLGSVLTYTDGTYELSGSIPTAGTYTLKAEFPGMAGVAAASAVTGVDVGIAPPIPLWKVGVVLLAIIGGGAGGYYALKGGER